MANNCVGCGADINSGEVACVSCMAIRKSTCYRCEGRVASPNCHDTCRTYIIRVSVEKALKERNRVGIDADTFSHGNREQCIRRRQRKVKIRPKFDAKW